jgi:DNA-binding transcriptional LysR family regulator
MAPAAGGGRGTWRTAFLTDDPEAERDAVLAGVGYGQLPHYLVAAELASGRLVTVLDDFAPPSGPVYSMQVSPARRTEMMCDLPLAYLPGEFRVKWVTQPCATRHHADTPGSRERPRAGLPHLAP